MGAGRAPVCLGSVGVMPALPDVTVDTQHKHQTGEVAYQAMTNRFAKKGTKVRHLFSDALVFTIIPTLLLCRSTFERVLLRVPFVSDEVSLLDVSQTATLIGYGDARKMLPSGSRCLRLSSEHGSFYRKKKLSVSLGSLASGGCWRMPLSKVAHRLHHHSRLQVLDGQEPKIVHADSTTQKNLEMETSNVGVFQSTTTPYTNRPVGNPYTKTWIVANLYAKTKIIVATTTHTEETRT